MSIEPVQPVGALISKYTGVSAPANIVVLAPRSISSFGPEGSMGSANPDTKNSPYSGIYDQNGKLPTIRPPGTTFMAKA
jgi:hypothetical protein